VLTLIMDIAGWDDNSKRKWLVMFLLLPYAVILFRYWMA